MNIFKKIRRIEYDPNQTQIFGIKSGIVWGHFQDSNECLPLLYISKPRGITQEDFDMLLDVLDICIVKRLE